MPPIRRVRDFASRHALWTPAARVLVALSGGGDSVALLILLDELARAGDITLAGACHVHHHIRGAEADEDERFCRRLADRLAIPLTVVHRDVPALATEARQSLEVAGRLARRAALVETAAALGADWIATAHTRDDQAETVLLRIVRGTGISGLGGIRPRRGPFVRPLLAESRATLRAWLRDHGETWREDATNEDRANPRNRVRHELLPYIREHFNPSAEHALARLADVAGAEDEFLAASALSEEAAGALALGAGVVSLDGRRVTALPKAVARRLVRRALEMHDPSHVYGLDEVDVVLEACAAQAPAALELRNLRVERIRPGEVLLKKRELARHAPPFRYELSVPGTVEVAEAGCVVEAEGPMPAGEAGPLMGGDGLDVRMAQVPADSLIAGLIVRSRAPGDRLRLRGVAGRTKVQDLFVDRKVSRLERDRIPIVTDAAGRIIWVGGVALSGEFRVNERTKAVVVLKLRRL